MSDLAGCQIVKWPENGIWKSLPALCCTEFHLAPLGHERYSILWFDIKTHNLRILPVNHRVMFTFNEWAVFPCPYPFQTHHQAVRLLEQCDRCKETSWMGKRTINFWRIDKFEISIKVCLQMTFWKRLLRELKKNLKRFFSPRGNATHKCDMWCVFTDLFDLN